MKKILFSVAVVLLIISIVSCDEDFLDTTSKTSYNESNFWESEEHAIAAINGCYQALTNGTLYGIRPGGIYGTESYTPNAYSSSGASVALALGTHNSGNVGIFENMWNASYRGIGRVNNLLANVDEIDMNQDLKTRIKGEAYFLRALFYSNLVNYYGGVPLILDAPNVDEQDDLPRNTRAEVTEQVLVDLDQASENLPLSYSGTDIGRATRGAALGLKTRVLLYESRWEDAAQSAKEVIEMEEYSLFPNYRELFMPENENNEEVIFDIQFKTPEISHNANIILELQENIAPVRGLVNSYLMVDGQPMEESPLFNPAEPYENRDPRLLQTIAVPGYMYKGEIVSEDQYFSTGYIFKKYTAYNDDVAPEANIQQSEINPILLRYADILLMYAEAKNESSGPDNSIYEALNKIRNRAGMPEISTGLSQDELRKIIRHERRIELAGEGLYYNDIRRWQIAEDVMNAQVYDNRGEVLQTRSFNPGRDYLWPIHQVTLQENSALEQNSGY